MREQKTLLLVEDEVVIALDQARQLQKRGYRVLQALDGSEAVRAGVEGEAVDLVLMDIDLGPGMDGIEAAREILGRRDLPLIFLSSHTEEELVARTEGVSNYGYIVKGSGLTVLDASIKMAFKLHEARLALEEANLRLGREVRERRRAEEDLERFFSLVPDMVCIASTEGYFQRLNPEWERVLGFPREELLSRPFADFIHPEDREGTFREVERQIRGQATIRFSNRYRSATGAYRWLEWRATPSPDGRLLFAAARDVTEGRETEEGLRRALAERGRLGRGGAPGPG